jgi:hypothetical protein
VVAGLSEMNKNDTSKPLVTMVCRFHIVAILSALSLGLLTGCMQQITELQVLVNGTSTPRSDREKLIFDYFNALRDRRCSAAYEMWAGSNSIPDSHEYFIKDCMAMESLPIRISIGKETQRSVRGERCGYRYVIYVADPDAKALHSGELSLHENPKKPGSCQIAYNSAFGPT